MDRTRGFVNLNRFKHSRTVKRISKAGYEKPARPGREKVGGRGGRGGRVG